VGHRRSFVAYLLDLDHVAGGLQVDAPPDRRLFPGEASPILELDDERLFLRLHDAPAECGR
jgi:hypothetical protein